MSSHLTRKQLLRDLDAELSKFKMWKTTRHIRTCPNCASELARLKEQLAIIVEADEILGRSVPPPPKVWPRLEPRLAVAYAGSRRSRKNAVSSQSAFRMPLAFSGAALMLLFVALLIWGPPAPVSAKEVIARSAAADAERLNITPQQVVRQVVQVTKTRALAFREETARLESWKSVHSTYWASGGDPVDSELLDRYRANGLASALPLSPVALQSWVKLAGSEPNASRREGNIEIQVVSNAEGRARGLEEVGFQVQERTSHMNEMTLSFEDTTFHITEEESSILDRRQVPPAVMAQLEPQEPSNAAIPARQALPAAPREVSPTPVNLDDLEMAVRYDLHRLGADLGESVEITAAPNQLVVNASGASPHIREQLATLLANKPGVRLEFQMPARGRPGQATTITAFPQSTAPPQDERLLSFFGGADTEENYARPVLYASTDVLAHLYALVDLADRWPLEREVGLSAEPKTQLAQMVRDHARDIQAAVSELKPQVNFLLKGLGYPVIIEMPGARTSWQNASISGLEAARSSDHVLRSLLTTSNTPMSLDDGLPKLQQSFQELERAASELAASAP